MERERESVREMLKRREPQAPSLRGETEREREREQTERGESHRDVVRERDGKCSEE